MASSHNSARSRLGTFRRLADGRVTVTVSHGYDADGRQRRVSRVADSIDDADRVALELAAELGRRPDLGNGVTLSRWWDAYAVGKGARLARGTFARYSEDMRRVWLPALGGTDISMVTRRDVQAVLLSLPTRQRATHAKATLSAVLTQAVREGHLESNPLRGGGFEMPGDVGTAQWDDADYDADPFAAIEGRRDVWDARTVLRAMGRMEGVAFEGAWLAMVGGGLRMEEAFALRWRDVRRVVVGGREVTQIAVHHAETVADGRKRTKTRQSRRIVAVVEPFGARLWSLRGEDGAKVSDASLNNVNRQWRRMWEPVTSKHAPKSGHRTRGRMVADPPIPYVPMSRMRATHETYMQEAGVLDSVNAAVHGHSQAVSYRHYQRPDVVGAAIAASDFLMSDV